MNVFLACIWKKDEHPAVDQAALMPYLLKREARTESWRSPSGHVELHSFSYWSGTIFPQTYLFQRTEEAVTFDGIPDTGKALTTPSAFEADLFETVAQDIRGIQGEFAVAHASGRKLSVYSNPCGTHAVYCTDQPGFTAFSNRLPLLLQLPGVPHDLDPEAMKWLCYQGFVQRGTTGFKAVRKLSPGDLAEVSAEGTLCIRPCVFSEFVREGQRDLSPGNLVRVFGEHCASLVDYIAKVHTFSGGLGITLPLSGGKDSRLILALLLAAGLKDKIESIYTDGPLYAPDVVGAQAVTKKMGLTHCHRINRPGRVRDSVDLNMAIISHSVNVTGGQLSVYDFCGIPPEKKELLFAGHQSVRDAWFLPCDSSSMEAFVRSLFSRHFHDPSRLLADGVRKTFQDDYASLFRRYHQDEGVPIDTLAELYALRERHNCWVAVILMGGYHASPISNVLMHPSVYSLALAIPTRLRHKEIYHFMMMAEAAPELLDIPFADQQWPAELRDAIKGIREVPVIPPYRSSVHFPSLANPYLPPIKTAYFNALKPYMASLAEKHADFLAPHLSTQGLQSLMRRSSDVLVTEIICGMGLYTSLLLAEFGADLFHLDKMAAIAEHLGSVAQGSERLPQQTPSQEDATEEVIRKHEQSIAAFVGVVQSIERPAEQQANRPAEIPWRHIRICNENAKAENFFLRIAEEKKTPWPTGEISIACDTTFTWGIQLNPPTKVSVMCNEIGFRQDIEIEHTVHIYHVNVPETYDSCPGPMISPAQQEPARPPAEVPWRHLRICNKNAKAENFFLLIAEEGKDPWPTAVISIACGTTFTWGVQMNPPTKVSVMCNDIGFRQDIDIEHTVHIYQVPVPETQDFSE